MGTVGRGAIVERGKKNGWKKKKRRKVQEKVLKTEKGPKRGQEIRKNKATNKEQIGVIVESWNNTCEKKKGGESGYGCEECIKRRNYGKGIKMFLCK